MTSSRRETIWLGSNIITLPDEPDDWADYDISTEDDMVSVSCAREDGSRLEVFICPNLFDAIRGKMAVIESRAR